MVPWEDFKKILDEIRRAEPVVPIPPPPVNHAFSECRVSVDVGADEKQATVRIELPVQVLNREEWVEVPVIAEGVALSRFDMDGRPASVYRKNGKHHIALRGEGEHELSLEYLTPVHSGRGTHSVYLPFPDAPVIGLDLTIPRPKLEISVSGAVIRSLVRTPAETRVRTALQQTSSASITWFKQAELGEKETKIFGEVRTLLSIGEGMVRGTATAAYTIHGEGAETFTVGLPPDLNVLDVTAQGIREWAVTDAVGGDGDPVAGAALRVDLNHKARGNFAFQIAFERDLGEASAETAVPSFVLHDVLRDRGFIAVAAATNVEISPAGDLTNAVPVDPAELPPDLLAQAAQPILFGFKYLRHPVEVGLQIVRHEDLAVKRTIVESARLFTYLSPEGKRITSARYTVKNNRKQYLELTLPESAEGWGVYLEDRPVKAAMNAEGAILIPLKKTAGNGADELEPFDVELVYFQPETAATWGSARFTGPVLDVDALEVQWHLFLPRDHRYFSFQGNLHADDELNRILYIGSAAYNVRARDDVARLRSSEVDGKTVISDGRRNIRLEGALQQLGGEVKGDVDLEKELRSLGYVSKDAADAPEEDLVDRDGGGKAGALESELKKLARKRERRADAPAAPPPPENRPLATQVWNAQVGGTYAMQSSRTKGVLPVSFGIPVEGLRLSFTGRILTADEAPTIAMRSWPLGWTLPGSLVFLLSLALSVLILGLQAGLGGAETGRPASGRGVMTLLAAAGLFALFVLTPESRGDVWLGLLTGTGGFIAARVLSRQRRAPGAATLLGLLVLPAGLGAGGVSPAHAGTPVAARAEAAARRPPLPDLKGTEITLSWEDFKKVVERTYLPPVVPPVPPAPASLRWAEYQARLEPGLLTLDGTLQLQVLQEGWIRFPLFTQGTLFGFEGNGALLRRNGNQVEILARGPATYDLRARLAFPAGDQPGENRLRIALPAAASNLLELSASASFKELEVDSGLVYRTAGDRLFVAAQDGVLGLKYTLPFRQAEEHAGEEVKLQPRVQLQTYQLLRLGDGVLSGVLVHDYNVRVAEVAHFDIDLPEGIVIFDCAAPGLESWKILQREGRRSLRLKLLAPADGAVRGIVHFEGTYDPEEGRVPVPRFAPLDVERESGFVAVAAEGAELALDLSEKLLPADVSELPPDVAAIDGNLISTYKYSGAPDAATVRITEHQDAPVLTAIIESLNATAAVLENGTEATWVDLSVKNNRKQFLTLRVPGSDVEIWSLLLNDQPAKPKRTGNEILIPLPRGEGEVISRISLVLLRRGAEIRPFGRIDPYLPSFDVPVSEALWTVYLPQGLRYAPRENGFRPVVVTAPPVAWGNRRGGRGMDGMVALKAPPASLDEASEAYGLSDSVSRAQAEQEAQIAGQMKQKAPSRRGALPVRIAVPGGIQQLPRVTMSRMLIVGDEDNTFTIRVYPAWITGALQALQRLLIMLSGILAGLALGGFLGRRALVGVLLLGVAGLIPFGGVPTSRALILWGMVVPATWGAVLVYRRFRPAEPTPA